MKKRSSKTAIWRKALLEMAFIIFLFYSNLLMGQYNFGHNITERPIWQALRNIFTPENFMIALAASFIGHVVFDQLRKRL